ncbi:MAG: hypothetical protein E7517_02755 [Ruminococcaceae bacterium]|nr:hypothetical protein [Oscillospiraceae bacterium]
MNTLRIWASALSAAAILCAAVAYFKPHMRFEKVLKLALSAFLMTVLLTPFCGKNKIDIASFFPDESVAAAQQSDARDFLNEQQLNAAAQAIKQELGEHLKRKGYAFEEIALSMNIDEDNNISINEITITGVPEKQRQKVHDDLKREYRLEAAVR